MKKFLSPLMTAAIFTGLTAGMCAMADNHTDEGAAAAEAPAAPAKRKVKRGAKAHHAKGAAKGGHKSGCDGANGCDGSHKKGDVSAETAAPAAE